MKSVKKIQIACLLMFAFVLLASCSRDASLMGLEGDSPIPQALDVGGDNSSSSDPTNLESPCSGTRTQLHAYTILPVDPARPNDISVQVLPGPGLGLDPGCICSSYQVCIEISFPTVAPAQITYFASSLDDDAVALVPIGENGVEDLFWSGPTAKQPQFLVPGTVFSTPYKVCISSSSNWIARFSFPGGLPTGVTSGNAVIKVTGICVVDNLPEPHG